MKYRKDGDYGLGRDRLPANVAVPLVQVANKINAKPFMEYALSYALYNYKMVCVVSISGCLRFERMNEACVCPFSFLSDPSRLIFHPSPAG